LREDWSQSTIVLRALTEAGDQPKLTIKVPSAICGTGRVYCVVIGPATA
jgi:hypothetical protein